MNIQATPEQAKIVESNADKLQVNAFAGTGKTTALKLFAENNPNKRNLYLCYNKSMQVEAEKMFPGNTKTLTAHSLAYRKIGYQFKDRIKGYLPIIDMQKFLNTDAAPIIIKHIGKTIENFCQNSTETIEYEHVPLEELRLLKIEDLSPDGEVIKKILGESQKYWQAVKNRLAPIITHDMYLKLYQLTKPNIEREFDSVLLDEAQDANPVILDIFLRQKNIQQVLVGDQHQAIYAWRGAINALSKKEGFEQLYLTESFRFGPEIAKIANLLLTLKGESRELKGLKENTYLGAVRAEKNKAHTMLFRYNHSLFHYAFSLLDGRANKGKDTKIYIEGGLNNYALNDLYALIDFYSNGKSNHILYSQFKNYHDFVNIANKTENIEALKMIQLISVYGSGLRGKLKKLEADQATVNKTNCDYHLLTAHKSKGMEYDSVELYDDFTYGPFDLEYPNSRDDNKTLIKPYMFIPKESRHEILNLLYVASTRAKNEFYLPKQYLEMYGYWQTIMSGQDTDEFWKEMNRKNIHLHEKTRTHLQAMDIEKALVNKEFKKVINKNKI